MIIKETRLDGSYIIDLDKIEDERGFFARVYCKNEFEEIGLEVSIVQINNSFNKSKGTIRGIHYQLFPKAEIKIVRCVNGAIWDVIIDLRKGSATFGQWHGEQLTRENRKMIYIPKGFGHGYITLEDNSEVIYLVTEFYEPEYERTIRWDDPKFKIKWPVNPTLISNKDKLAHYFNEEYNLNIKK